MENPGNNTTDSFYHKSMKKAVSSTPSKERESHSHI